MRKLTPMGSPLPYTVAHGSYMGGATARVALHHIPTLYHIILREMLATVVIQTA